MQADGKSIPLNKQIIVIVLVATFVPHYYFSYTEEPVPQIETLIFTIILLQTEKVRVLFIFICVRLILEM